MSSKSIVLLLLMLLLFGGGGMTCFHDDQIVVDKTFFCSLSFCAFVVKPGEELLGFLLTVELL